MENRVESALCKGALAAASFIVLAAAAPSVIAQTADAPETSVSLIVPAGPLSDTLFALSEQFGVTIVAPNELVSGKTAPAINGALSAEAAIAEALDGSGLSVTAIGNNSYTLVEAPVRNAPSQPTARPSTPTAEPVDDERVEEKIIITGSKLGFSLQETTNSVELLTSDRLEQDSVFDLSDAIARTPNASVIGGVLSGINIRGINRNGTGGAGQGQAINIYLDGAPLSGDAILGNDSVWDLKQIEVLRGSQSILQGRNALAGAVVVETRDPTYVWEGAARARVGEFGERQYAGVLSGPLIADQIAFRLSAEFDEADGIVTDGNSGENDGAKENITLRGKLLVEPKALEDLSAVLTVEYTESDFGRVSPFVLSPGGPDGESNLAPERIARLAAFDPTERVSFPIFPVFSDIETLKLIGDVTYDFTDNISLELIGTYEDLDRDDTNFRREPNRFGDVGTQTLAGGETISADARLKFDYDKLTGLVGAYYFDTERTFDQSATNIIADAVPFLIDPADSIITFTGNGASQTDSVSIYTSWRYEPNEDWTFDFGLRYDDESFETRNEITGFTITPDTCTGTAPGFVFNVPLPFVTVPCSAGAELLRPPSNPVESDDFTVFLPSAAVTYNINEDFSVFVGARQGYRAGGTFVARSLQNVDNIFEVIAFDPEFLDTFEAGWRSQWLDRRLTFNGTAYYSQYRDQQVSFTDEEGFSRTTNAGETSLYGIEVSFDYEASENWDIYGSLALKDTEFDTFLFREDDPSTPTVNEELDLAGNELDRAENVSFTLGSSYIHESGVFGSASLSYKSEYWSDIFNLGIDDLDGGLTERIDAAAILNARIGYRYNNAVLSLIVQNLTDEDSPEQVNYAGAGILNGTAGYSNQAGVTIRQPRTVSVSLDVAF
ncbi:MAG: TonB-dependent receptor [Pseudomonadota bacterium]